MARKPTIVLVDDTRGEQLVWQSLFQDRAPDVRFRVADSFGDVEGMLQDGVEVDLFLVDYSLRAGMTGLAVCEELRPRGFDTVLVSYTVPLEPRSQAYRDRGDFVDKAQLVGQIDALASRARANASR